MGIDPKKDAKLFSQINKDLKELNGLYQKLGEQNPFENLDASKVDLKQIKEIKEYLADARSEADLIFGSFRNVKEEVDEIFSGLNSITDEITKQKQGFNLTKKAVSSLTNVMGSVKDIQDDILNANSADLIKLQDKALAERKNLVEAKRLLELHENIGDESSKEYIALQNVNGILADNNGLFGDMSKTLEQVVKNEQHVEKITGGLGSAVDGLSSGMKKAGLGAMEQKLGLGDALKSTKNMVKASGGNATKMQAASHLAKGLGKNLMKSLGPAALIALAIQKIVEAFKLIDGESGKIAKSQGLSAAEGVKIVGTAHSTAMLSGDLLVSTKDIVKSQSSLNKLMGTSTQYPAQMAIDMNTMSEKLALSEQSMSFFATNAIKGKGSIMEQLEATSDVTTQLNQQNKLNLSLKDIQEGIGNLSASQRLSAKGSVEELSKQVYQTKLLGLAAGDLEGVQNSLLDFEESITAEMEAELMTGKQLNLEGARAAALAGDQAALAVEIRKEVGTEAEFMAMNVKQREAMAKAFGLNINQMAEMLSKQAAMEKMQKSTNGLYKSQSEAQAAYNKLIDEGMSAQQAADKMKEQGIDNALAAQMKSATQTDKMAAIGDKLTDVFVGLVEPLMPVMDILMSIIEKAIKPMMPQLKIVTDIIGVLVDIIGGALGPIIETLMTPTMMMAELFGDIRDMITELLPEGTEMGNIFSTIGEILGTIVSIYLLPMQIVIRTIIGLVRNMMTAFGGIKKIFEGDILGGLKDIASGFIGIVLTPFQVIVDLVIGALNLAIKAANKIPFVDIPKVPEYDLKSLVGLKDGGIIEPSPQGTPALIGEGGEAEAVIPLSKAGEMGFGGGNMTETNNLLKSLISAVNSGGNVYLDGNKVGKSLAVATSRMG